MSVPPEMARHMGKAKDLVKFYNDMRQRYDSLVNRAHTWTTCLQCGERYRPVENLQRRNCYLHTGEYRSHTVGYGAWTCCGSPRDIVGCVSCMHTENPAILESMHDGTFESMLEMPQDALDFRLLRFNANIVEDYPEGSASIEGRTGKFYHIRRVVV